MGRLKPKTKGDILQDPGNVRIGASLSGPQLEHSHSLGKSPYIWKILQIRCTTKDLYPEGVKNPPPTQKSEYIGVRVLQGVMQVF